MAIYTLWHREIVRFLRQKNRVVGALVTPILFWWLIGSGLGRSFQTSVAAPGETYLHYFFPGAILLMVLFTAIFSTVSIIEDRREGFLQGVLVAPRARSALVWGKLLGGSTLATAQGLLFAGIGLFLGLRYTWIGLVELTITLFLLGLCLTSLGYLIAWPLDSTQGFHALMNLVLMPLWLLSGALFPPEGASTGLRFLIYLNPLHYGLEALRANLNLGVGSELSLGWCYGILLGFALLLGGACRELTVRYTGKTS
jgi:ABC-2 type transport system permease protein